MFLIQRRGRRSARDPTGRSAVHQDFVTVTADTPAAHFEPDQSAREAGGLLLFQRFAAHKIAPSQTFTIQERSASSGEIEASISWP